MKVLITGANGLLGQKLVKLLSESEHYEVVATGRGPNRNPAGNYAYRTLDITSAEQIDDLILEEKPDCLVNTAAMTHVDQCEQNKEDCWEQNVTAVKSLATSAEKIDCFFLHLSTDFVFDGEEGPYSETDTPNPVSYYGESKLAAEKVLQNSSLRWAVARTMLVYGIAHDMSRSNIILWVKNSLENKKEIKVVNDQWRMPTLAEDLAMGCKLILDKQAEGIFNISGKDMLTPYDMAIATADFFGLDQTLIEEVDGSIFTQPAKRPPRTGFILEKPSRELGYQPHSFTEGLETLQKQLSKK